MQPPGSQGGAEIENFRRGGEGGLATFSHSQKTIIEIYLGTLQPWDFPYWPVCFVAICNMQTICKV